MKPNIILIIHYNSTSTSFSTTNTNGGPVNNIFICKGYEVVHQVHTHLNPYRNDTNLPYHLGYHLEGVYNKEGILNLSSVQYNGLT